MVCAGVGRQVCVWGQVCGVCRCGKVGVCVWRGGQWAERTARCLLRPSPPPPAGGHQQRHPGDPAVRRVRLRGVSERARGSAPHLPAGEGVETRDREGVTSRVQGRGEGPHGAAPEAPRVEVVTLLPRSKFCLNLQLPKPNKPQLCASSEAPSGCASPGRAEGEGAGCHLGAVVKPGLRGLGQDGRQLPMLKMACPRAALEALPPAPATVGGLGTGAGPPPLCPVRAPRPQGAMCLPHFPHRLCCRSP